MSMHLSTDHGTRAAASDNGSVARHAGTGPGICPCLSRREAQVLQLLVCGCSNREMARRMTVSPDTVKYHVKNLYGKLGVRCRTRALIAALDAGVLLRSPRLPASPTA